MSVGPGHDHIPQDFMSEGSDFSLFSGIERSALAKGSFAILKSDNRGERNGTDFKVDP
jgi:hypothetical protein